MSGVVDLPLVILQKAQHAAEAAAASAKMLETEAGHRLNSVEARLVGIEARLSSLYAGQASNTLSLMRIADTQSEHTTVLAEHTAVLAGHTAVLAEQTTVLAEHTAVLTEHTARFDHIDKRFDGIEQLLGNILAKLP